MPMSEVTHVLSAVKRGDPQAAEQLLPLVYDELRRLAAEKIARESPGQTLQATALVHEAYLRLVNGDTPRYWNSRGHFFAAAAEAMRRILIDRARRRKAQKRGGAGKRIALAQIEAIADSRPEELLLLDDALARLAREAPDAAELAKLRLFTGLSVEAAAGVLGVSRATAFRTWTYARAWLQARLNEDSGPGES
jgi:RNA polymerase sigma factor (TIGR02999 family)